MSDGQIIRCGYYKHIEKRRRRGKQCWAVGADAAVFLSFPALQKKKKSLKIETLKESWKDKWSGMDSRKIRKLIELQRTEVKLTEENLEQKDRNKVNGRACLSTYL